jgi:hypothetical protein
VHCVFNELRDVVDAVHALRSGGHKPGAIHVMASWDYVEAIERSQRRQNVLVKLLVRLHGLLDEGLGDAYLREARCGGHVLALRLSKMNELEEIRQVLCLYNARAIRYVGIWAVADLSCDQRSIPYWSQEAQR